MARTTPKATTRRVVRQPRNPGRELKLYKACSNKTAASVHKLLAEGADPIHGLPTFSPPLVAAAGGGTLEIVDVLLAAGAPVDEYGAQALASAALRDSEEGRAICARLIERGALTARTGAYTRGVALDLTPLAVVLALFDQALHVYTSDAKAKPHLEPIVGAIERLVAAGADVEAPSTGKRPAEQLAAIVAHHADRAIAATVAARIASALAR